MLEVQGVVKSFGGLKAVDGCSLEVRQGSITGLIGPNGAGKTTLFNIITGRYKPDRGKITFQGQAIEGLPPHEIFKKKMYRTFQITREFAQMSVLENLMIMPEYQSGEKIWNTWFRPSRVRNQEKAILEKALEVLEFVELIDLKNEYAGSLSGGQKKLLEIARSMMADPRIVLLDEPTASMALWEREKILDLIRLLKEQGCAIIMVTHNLGELFKVADRAAVLKEGRTIWQGALAGMAPDDLARMMFLGKV